MEEEERSSSGAAAAAGAPRAPPTTSMMPEEETNGDRRRRRPREEQQQQRRQGGDDRQRSSLADDNRSPSCSYVTISSKQAPLAASSSSSAHQQTRNNSSSTLLLHRKHTQSWYKCTDQITSAASALHGRSFPCKTRPQSAAACGSRPPAGASLHPRCAARDCVLHHLAAAGEHGHLLERKLLAGNHREGAVRPLALLVPRKEELQRRRIGG